MTLAKAPSIYGLQFPHLYLPSIWSDFWGFYELNHSMIWTWRTYSAYNEGDRASISYLASGVEPPSTDPSQWGAEAGESKCRTGWGRGDACLCLWTACVLNCGDQWLCWEYRLESPPWGQAEMGWSRRRLQERIIFAISSGPHWRGGKGATHPFYLDLLGMFTTKFPKPLGPKCYLSFDITSLAITWECQSRDCTFGESVGRKDADYTFLRTIKGWRLYRSISKQLSALWNISHGPAYLSYSKNYKHFIKRWLVRELTSKQSNEKTRCAFWREGFLSRVQVFGSIPNPFPRFAFRSYISLTWELSAAALPVPAATPARSWSHMAHRSPPRVRTTAGELFRKGLLLLRNWIAIPNNFPTTVRPKQREQHFFFHNGLTSRETWQWVDLN